MAQVFPIANYRLPKMKPVIPSIFLILASFMQPCVASNPNFTDSLARMSLEDLMNVEIYTAGKAKEKIKDIPASVILVTRDDIERYGYTTLTDILENVPGLYNIYSYAGVSGNFGVRGFWNPNSQNSNMAILVNGISQAYENDRTQPLEKINVPVEAIDRIEIVRGPMAVLYGNGASFGVINIITNQTNFAEKENLASMTLGELGTKKSVLRLVGKDKQLSFVINAARYETDGVNHPFSDMMSSGNLATLPAYGINDSNYRTKNLLKQKSKYIEVSGSFKQWLFDINYDESQVGLFLIAPPLEDGFTRHTTNTRMMLGYQSDLNEKTKLDFRTTYNNYQRQDLTEILVADVENSEIIHYNSLEFEFLATLNPSNKIQIVAGINYRVLSNLRDVIDAPSLGITNESFEKTDRTTRAIFSQASYQATDKIKLVAGIRYEELKSYQTIGITDGGLGSQTPFGDTRGDITSVSPRLAAIYAFNQNNILKFLYGTANRLGDDILDPEMTKTGEINYVYAKPGIFSSISLFQNWHQDLVVKDLVFENGSLTSKERNSGEVSTLGIEIIINKEVTNNLTGEVGITAQESKNESNQNIAVSYSPRVVAHGKLAYQWKNSILAAHGYYISGMLPQYDLTKQNPDSSFGARVGQAVDDYFVVDLNLRQNKIYKGVYLNVKVSNLLNQEIRYPNNQETNELLDRGTLGKPRMFIGTVGIEF